jgi:ABC-type dipeptide/oligopeptide/nickel transport system permease component
MVVVLFSLIFALFACVPIQMLSYWIGQKRADKMVSITFFVVLILSVPIISALQ